MTKARDLSKLLSTANGKIAGANLDVSFENIADTGTEGTKVASGTTAQRGSTTGQLRFNTETGLAEYYTGTDFKVIDSPPTVTAVSPLEVDSTVGGNITFTITGSNFQSGAVVKFIGNDATEITASTTTVNSGSSISAIIARSSFVNAKEPYDVKIINGSGLSGILDNQINVDTSPTWSTTSGTLGSFLEGASINASVLATDADGDTVSYSETGGTVLNTNSLTLNSATGSITGTAPTVSGDTTLSFTLRATANSKTVDRSFNIITKNLNENVTLFNATNLTGASLPFPSNSGLNGISPSTAVTFTNINGSSGTLADAILLTDKTRLDGYYNQSNIKNMGTSFWTISAPNSFTRDGANNSNWFGVYTGGGNNEVWFTLDMGENPSFKIRRLTGSSIWRTGSADFQLYGSNDVSNLNASSWSTTGLTNLFNIANPSQPWDSGLFTGAYYRYYVFRIYGSGGYDWGWGNNVWYGDYY
jgi:hypothetical protein